MADKNTAMQKIINGDFRKGFEELAEAFEADRADEEIITNLREGFFVPNLAQMTDNFLENIKLLGNYPYIFAKEFVEPEKNRYTLFPINENLYFCYDSEAKKLFPIEVSSNQETKYFFENLDNPLFVENEFNEFNLKFLEDNVRDSRDFAGDNHIYLWYENAELFSLLLYYANLKPLLEREKFIILIGEEERGKYPLNFKAEFEIDYNNMRPQKLRIEEMKRICYWVTRGYSGTVFALEVLNNNPHIIAESNVTTLCNVRYRDRYLCVLKIFDEILKNTKKTYSIDHLKDIIKSDNVSFSYGDDINETENKEIKETCFCAIDEIKQYLNPQNFTVTELIQACMVYWYYKKNPDINPRIIPEIVFEPHTGDKREEWMPIITSFSYYKAINSIRNQIITVGQILKAFHYFDCADYRIIQSVPSAVRDVYHVFKFEDLKLYPEETSKALCRYFNVPYSPQMLKDEALTHKNHRQSSYETKDLPKSKFDKTAVYRNVDSVLSQFDQVRLQIFFDPVNRHYGYPAFDFESCPMTIDDVVFLMKFPFLFEKDYTKEGSWGKTTPVQLRKFLHSQMVNVWLGAKQGQFKFPPVIRPEFDEKKGDNT